MTTEDFIQKALQVHPNNYDYSKVNYSNNKTKVCIICSKHGEFWQTPGNHLMGRGCKICSSENRKMSLSNFVEKSNKIHNNKYDYSKVNYINQSTKVCIICPEHGEFWQQPYNHLMGKGCRSCQYDQLKFNLNDFIKQANEIHANKYDYSKVEYINADTKVCIICPEHGEFWQRPSGHLRNGGCHECSGIKRLDNQKFIDRANKIHNNKYDYSKVDYKNSYTKVCIICPVHGEFWQNPHAHTNTGGCHLCGIEQTKIGLDKFIQRSNEIHDNKYDYSKTDYIGVNKPVCIICPVHGEFWQTPSGHLQGRGCLQCGIDRTKTKIDDLIKKFNKIHNNKYDYSKTDYNGVHTKVIIICTDHGEFLQTPGNHLMGKGCPKCSKLISHRESSLKDFIKENYSGSILLNKRNIIKPYELDIYLPELKLAFEFNGLYWHSEKYKDKNYHLMKTELCESCGIQLIHVYEDEWVYKQEIVKSKVLNLLGRTEKVLNLFI